MESRVESDDRGRPPPCRSTDRQGTMKVWPWPHRFPHNRPPGAGGDACIARLRFEVHSRSSPTRRSPARNPHARPVAAVSTRPPRRASGLAQGARAARLSGAGAAARRQRPALRAVVGRPQRSARRTALVPEQDPGPRSTSRAAGACRTPGTPSSSIFAIVSSTRSRSRGPPRPGIETLSPERLRALAASVRGGFPRGLAIDRSPVFTGWLTAQRRRLRGCRAAVLEQLVMRGPDDEALVYLDTWLRARAVRPAGARVPLQGARATRPDSRGRSPSGGDHRSVRARRSRVHADSRRLARSARTATGIAIQEPHTNRAADTAGRRSRLHRGHAVHRPLIGRASSRWRCRRASRMT